MLAVLFVAIVVLLTPLVWLLVTFNRLASTRVHLRDSWSGVEIELQRRYELVPNLVETVKGYAAHERETLEQVIRLRDVAAANRRRPDEQEADERALEAGVNRVLAVAEGYPELRASDRFLALQRELTLTEDRIAAGRRFFNANVRELNQLCRTFPTSLVARLLGFEPQGFFEAEEDARSAVSVDS
ncbi:MAG: LemA family protein [Planctomycetota bacterium]|nr:LemA family protein [Planctomycetota bacterium]MEE2973322.1 LemA family protein [Planctomycetota bacterium]